MTKKLSSNPLLVAIVAALFGAVVTFIIGRIIPEEVPDHHNHIILIINNNEEIFTSEYVVEIFEESNLLRNTNLHLAEENYILERENTSLRYELSAIDEGEEYREQIIQLNGEINRLEKENIDLYTQNQNILTEKEMLQQLFQELERICQECTRDNEDHNEQAFSEVPLFDRHPSNVEDISNFTASGTARSNNIMLRRDLIGGNSTVHNYVVYALVDSSAYFSAILHPHPHADIIVIYRIFGDDVPQPIHTSYTLQSHMMPEVIKVNVQGLSHLKIELEMRSVGQWHGMSGWLGIENAIILITD